MKILITGGTGFIGQHVLNDLKNYSDVEIVVLSRNEIPNKSEHYSYVCHDILNDNPDDLVEKCGRPDILIHLAWSALDDYDNQIHLKEFYPKHLKFLIGLFDQGIREMTIIGTCQEYGMMEGCLDEEMASVPSTSYSQAKDQLRKDLFKYVDNTSVSIKWLRLFYLYGQGQASRTLLAQLDDALSRGDTNFNMSGGEQIRDYLPVEDAAKIIVKISLQKKVSGIINCCSGKPITIKNLVENYIQSKNKKIHLNLGYYPYPEYEPMAFWGNTKKLESIINI